jgi:hypothetical protein
MMSENPYDGDSRKACKRRLWRNVLVSALNEGLRQGYIKPVPQPWQYGTETGEDDIYPFTFMGLDGIAHVRDAGHGELVVHAIVNPTAYGREFVQCYLQSGRDRARAGTVWASGWFERQKGMWLQTTRGGEFIAGSSSLYVKRSAAWLLSAEGLVPAVGYADQGQFLM